MSRSPHPHNRRSLVLGVALLAVAAAASASAPVELLTGAAASPGDLTKTQLHHLDRLLAEPAVGEYRLVRPAVDPDAVDGPLLITPFAGETVELTESRVERRSATDYTWFGTRPGYAVQAIVVVNGEHLTGSIVDGDRHFILRPLGGGLAVVARLDASRLPPDHPPGHDALERSAPEAPVGDSDGGCSYVDLIVAYTIDAGQAVADIYGLAQLAVAETNQSYANSGVVHRVRMVHFYGTDYYDSGNMVLDRNRFRDDGDGYMDEVHVLRNAFHADVGMLITDRGAYCGIASAIYASASTAFAVVAQNCATGYYSFGHEIGHLHGCRHNPEADPGTTPFAFGHGYYYQPGSWRTVMSYNCPGGCTRIPYWSNPYVSYGDAAMGTAATHDNHRALNLTCSHVAGFR